MLESIEQTNDMLRFIFSEAFSMLRHYFPLIFSLSSIAFAFTIVKRFVSLCKYDTEEKKHSVICPHQQGGECSECPFRDECGVFQ